MNDSFWRDEYRKRITTRSALEKKIDLAPEEAAFFNLSPESPAGTKTTHPLSITEYYLSLFGEGLDCPIRRQAVPRIEEEKALPYELADPLGEAGFSPLPRLIHRYDDRALLLVSDLCAVYCRHCFRRHFTSSGRGRLTKPELKEIIGYLSAHGEIRELLLSGGDPLTLGDREIDAIIGEIVKERPDLSLRLCTRMPAVLPSRITEELVLCLCKYRSLWVVTHFNHPLELTEQSTAALSRFIDSGIPVVNQTVLLRGVNDSVSVLETLFSGLVYRRVKPYYLLQGDLARGTGHLRVPLKRSFGIVRELRSRISGLAMPVFAMDLPGGGGKIMLRDDYPPPARDGWHCFASAKGIEYRYPEE